MTFESGKGSEQARRAAVLVCVLACLIVVTGLMVSLAKSTIQARRETRLRHQMQQTQLLLDAGIARASRKFSESPTYQGETWKLSTNLGSFEHPIVIVAVMKNENEAEISVTASLGSEKSDLQQPIAQRTVCSHRFTLKTKTESKQRLQSDSRE